MADSQEDPELAIFLGAAVILVALILFGYGAAFGIGSGTDDQVTVKSLKQLDEVDSEQPTLVKLADGEAVIRGAVTGRSSGMQVAVQSVGRVNDTNEVRVKLTTEDPDRGDVFLPVLTQYGYELTLENVDDEDNIIVAQNGETYNLSNQNKSNGDSDMSDKQDSNKPEVSFEYLSSSGANPNEGSVNVERNGDTIIVEGVIVGNTGGQMPFLAGTGFDGNRIELTVGLKKPDGLATQVITGYKYRITIEDASGYDTVTVNHEGREIEETTI